MKPLAILALLLSLVPVAALAGDQTQCWRAPIVRTSLDEFGNTVSSTAKILDQGTLCLDMSDGASAFSVRTSENKVFIQARGLELISKKDGTSVYSVKGNGGNATFFIGNVSNGTFIMRGCFWRANDVTCATAEIEVEKPTAKKPAAPKSILPSNLPQSL